MKILSTTIILSLILQVMGSYSTLFAVSLTTQGFYDGTNFDNRAIENSSFSWTNLDNIVLFDGAYATTGPLTSKYQYSDYLAINGFGFSIPENALISGIEIKLKHKFSDTENEIKDYLIQIVKNGIVCAGNKALLSNWQAQDTTVIYGSSSDTWGETWCTNDINASDFGAVISVIRSGNSGVSATAMIDNVKIMVYYEEQTLPVLLIEFNAYSVGDYIQLHWSTGSEINADYVAIERSADGSIYDIIGTVECAGNTHFVTYYSFTDNSPPAGTLYYRLRQIDIDGSYTHSNIVSVNNMASARDSPLLVYPCPSNGSGIKISLRSPGEQKLILCIKSISGQNVFTEAVYPGSKGYSEVFLPPYLQLDAGIYIITVETTYYCFNHTLIIH
ncbi:MAG: hypothetical protein ABII90_14445 [Bacteroidota bacterium]